MVETLTKKNDVLKSNLSGLKKKHNQMRMKQAVHGFGGQNGGGPGAEGNEESKESALAMATQAMKDALEGNRVVSSQVIHNKNFDELPQGMKVMAWKKLTDHVLHTVDNHPLTPHLPPDVVKEVGREAALELRDVVAQVLWTLATEQEGRDESSEVLVSRALGSASLQAELTPVITMLLSYAFKRRDVLFPGVPVQGEERRTDRRGLLKKGPSLKVNNRREANNSGNTSHDNSGMLGEEPLTGDNLSIHGHEEEEEGEGRFVARESEPFVPIPRIHTNNQPVQQRGYKSQNPSPQSSPKYERRRKVRENGGSGGGPRVRKRPTAKP